MADGLDVLLISLGFVHLKVLLITKLVNGKITIKVLTGVFEIIRAVLAFPGANH